MRCSQTRGLTTVTLPDSLKQFIETQVNSGRYENPDDFVAELVKTEAEIFERVNRGEALSIDQHFDRRLKTLLDEAEKSDCVDRSKDDFDAVERESLELVRKRKRS